MQLTYNETDHNWPVSQHHRLTKKTSQFVPCYVPPGRHAVIWFTSLYITVIASAFFVKQYFPVRIFWFLIGGLINHAHVNNDVIRWRSIVKTGMPPFGILANHKIKMCNNSMKKIMIQKITQNNLNFWTVNLIMRAKKLLSSRQIFRYAVPARTVTKKALVIAMKQWANWSSSQLITGRTGHFVYIYTALLTISELSSFSCFLTRHYYVISHFTLTGAQTVFKVSYNLSTIEPAVVMCLFQLSSASD